MSEHTHEHTHTYTHEHPHGHDGQEHSHEHTHTYTHSHEHSHDGGDSHEHTHDHEHENHDHDHQHEHGHSHGTALNQDQVRALLDYNYKHNTSHADELAGLASKLESLGNKDAAAKVAEAKELFSQGNDALKQALELLSKV